MAQWPKEEEEEKASKAGHTAAVKDNCKTEEMTIGMRVSPSNGRGSSGGGADCPC